MSSASEKLEGTGAAKRAIEFPVSDESCIQRNGFTVGIADEDSLRAW
jgi:hypothetical protein